jgi:hypothetical protein
MTHISEQTIVHAPLASASAFLAAVLNSHTPAGSEEAHVVLHAGEAKQATVVTVTPLHQAGDMTPRFHIHWAAEHAAAFPIFDGELLIAGDEDYDTFRLELNGNYVPPGGVAGAVFDAAVGRHIAHASAREFLASMRRQIEWLFTDQERAKAARAGAKSSS